MRINIEAKHIEVSEEMKEQITTKVSRLEHFYENIMDAIVFLHEENSHKEVEIKLNVPNETLFVKEKAENFGAGLDSALESMKRQVVKYKEKQLKK